MCVEEVVWFCECDLVDNLASKAVVWLSKLLQLWVQLCAGTPVAATGTSMIKYALPAFFQDSRIETLRYTRFHMSQYLDSVCFL